VCWCAQRVRRSFEDEPFELVFEPFILVSLCRYELCRYELCGRMSQSLVFI